MTVCYFITHRIARNVKKLLWGNFFKVLINYYTWGYKNTYWCLVIMIFYFISVQIYHRLIYSIKMHSIIPIKAPISGQEISLFIFGKWCFTMLKQIILYFQPNEFTRTLKHLQNERSIWLLFSKLSMLDKKVASKQLFCWILT